MDLLSPHDSSTFLVSESGPEERTAVSDSPVEHAPHAGELHDGQLTSTQISKGRRFLSPRCGELSLYNRETGYKNSMAYPELAQDSTRVDSATKF